MNKKTLINHKDFASAHIYIKLRNLVSDTVIDSNIKTIGNLPMGEASVNNQIQLLELLNDGLILSVPKYTCGIRHGLELELTISNMSRMPLDVRLHGHVKDIEKASETQDRVHVTLQSLSDPGWKDLCQLFASRQEEIHQFFKSARGY